MWVEQGEGEEDPIDLKVYICDGHSQKLIAVYMLDLRVVDRQG